MSEKEVVTDKIEFLNRKMETLKKENDTLQRQLEQSKNVVDSEKLRLKVQLDKALTLAASRSQELDAKTQELRNCENVEADALAKELSEVSRNYLFYADLAVLPLSTLRTLKKAFTADTSDTYFKLYSERQARDMGNRKQGITFFNSEKQKWETK